MASYYLAMTSYTLTWWSNRNTSRNLSDYIWKSHVYLKNCARCSDWWWSCDLVLMSVIGKYTHKEVQESVKHRQMKKYTAPTLLKIGLPSILLCSVIFVIELYPPTTFWVILHTYRQQKKRTDTTVWYHKHLRQNLRR